MAKSGGLGKGLGALVRNDINNFDDNKTTVSIGRLEPREPQPRKNFDEKALEELADSIREYGIIQPITVRELDNGYYQIIAGERRWRAAKLAGLNNVPVSIIEADDRKAQEIALVENLQREDLNPIEEARGVQSLMMEFGLTQEEAARRIGKSRPSITNALRLLNLAPTVIEMIEKGELTAGHGRALLPLMAPEVQESTAKTIIEKGLNVRQTETLIKRILTAPKPTENPETDNIPAIDYAKIISEQLGTSMGRRVIVKDGRKNGRIEIEYYGADDREALIEMLMSLKKRNTQE